MLSPFYRRTLNHREVQKSAQVSKLVSGAVGICILASGVGKRAQLWLKPESCCYSSVKDSIAYVSMCRVGVEWRWRDVDRVKRSR